MIFAFMALQRGCGVLRLPWDIWGGRAVRTGVSRAAALAAIGWLSAGGAARAGPWVDDQARTIASLGYGPAEAGARSEADIYEERPFRKGLAGVVKVRNEIVVETETAEAEVAVKGEVWRRPGVVAAVQAGATWRDTPAPGCGEWGGEVRVLSGAAAEKAFATLELAGRAEEGGCPHVRLDGAVGWRPNRSWMAMTQVFIDKDLAYEHVTKVQASLVRFSRRGRGVQIGVRAELDGREFRAPILIVSYWSSPRL
jgi:hypothetical protein